MAPPGGRRGRARGREGDLSRRAMWGVLLAAACGGSHVAQPAPRPAVRFEVLGNASPADTSGPSLRIDSQVVTIRGIGVQITGAGIYGDVDVSEPHTLRLTLYDSLPGRPVDDPLPPVPPSQLRQVIYEAHIGPIAPGEYDVWIGRFDARARMVEVAHAPLHIRIEATDRRRQRRPPPDSAGGRQ